MTREQYEIFKSDLKKGMRIIRLEKLHRKAYWNDGFKSQEEQREAIKRESGEVKTLKTEIIARYNVTEWIPEKGYTETGKTNPYVIGDLPEHHWAYYCAKHILSEEDSIKYLENELKKLTPIKHSCYYDGDAKRVYEKWVKPILTRYEEIVCPSR